MMDYEKLAEQMAEAIDYMDTNTLDMREVKDSGLYIDMTHDASGLAQGAFRSVLGFCSCIP